MRTNRIRELKRDYLYFGSERLYDIMPRSNNTSRVAGGGAISRIQRHLTLANLRKWLWILFRTALIAGLAFMILFPLSTKISRSFMTWEDVNDPTVYYIPRNFTLDNFRVAWTGLQYPITLLKSIGITGMVTLLQTASCTLVAYGLARFDFIGKKFLFATIILTLLIPPQAILTPLYLRFRYFNPVQIFITGGIMSGISLINTLVPFVILSATALAFKSGLYIYMLRQFFTNMPKELVESAFMDGCGHFRTFYRIMQLLHYAGS